jgi:ribonuclease Z
MELTLLGTGCPQVDPKRMGPANLVRHGDAAFMVDCGSGATQRLVEAGSAGRALTAVLLTHLHSDHIVDLYQLFVSSWHQGRLVPQRVFGPPGTRRFVDGLFALWKPELEARIAHEQRLNMDGLKVEVTEFTPGRILEAGGVTVRAVEVAHQPVTFAYGFVLEAGGRKLAFSGDTAYCPALIEASKGADVLVHECFIHSVMKPAPGIRTEQGIRNVASYHTLSSEVGKVAAAAGVKCLVLNHFVPTQFDRAGVLAEVRRDYAGPIVIGEDLMRLDLDAAALSYRDAVIGLDALSRAGG